MSKKVMAIVAVIALVAILGVCLVACNAEDYQKKLEKKGYTVVSTEGGDTVEWALKGSKMEGATYNTVNIVKYVNTDDAKAAETDAKKVYGENGTYRVGKIVIFGTEQGVKDAK